MGITATSKTGIFDYTKTLKTSVTYRINVMKTITIQLLKSLIFPEKDIYKLRNYFRTLEEYAPPEVYDYKKLGGTDILMLLNTEVLTKDLVPMLEDFYKEFPDINCVQQRNAVLQEFGKFKEITWGLCEETGYKHSEAFYPAFMNDAYPKPFLMYEEGVKADCTGIVLHIIPPEKATFAMLYTLEKELQTKLASHPLVKALKVCIR